MGQSNLISDVLKSQRNLNKSEITLFHSIPSKCEMFGTEIL